MIQSWSIGGNNKPFYRDHQDPRQCAWAVSDATLKDLIAVLNTVFSWMKDSPNSGLTADDRNHRPPGRKAPIRQQTIKRVSAGSSH